MGIPLMPMAMLITVENYPVAVACLPPVFATIPTGKVLGCYLVINEAGVQFHKGGRQTLTISNGWMKPKLFMKTYAYVEDHPDVHTFEEVYRIS